MERQADCIVTGPMALVLQVSRFVGLAPLRFARTKKGWRVGMSQSLYIFGYLFAILYSAATIWSLIIEYQWEIVYAPHIITPHVARRVEVLLGISSCIVMIFTTSGHMRCIIRSLNEVRKITSDLNLNSCTPQWKKIQIGSFIFWMFISVICITTDAKIMFSTFTSNRPTWFNMVFLSYFLCNWIIQLGITQFMLLVTHVRFSFKAINHCLKNVLKDIDQQHVSEEKHSFNVVKKINHYIEMLGDGEPLKLYSGCKTNSKPHHETVHRIASAYASACDVVRDVDRSYGLTLMVLLTDIFVHLVVTSYYLITNFADPGHIFPDMKSLIIRQLLQFFWILFYVTNLVIAVEPCHLTSTEVAYTTKLVSCLMRRVDSIHDPLAIELEQFSRHLALNDVSYRPLNVVVTMKRGLVLAIFSSITTYLVIMVNINN